MTTGYPPSYPPAPAPPSAPRSTGGHPLGWIALGILGVATLACALTVGVHAKDKASAANSPLAPPTHPGAGASSYYTPGQAVSPSYSVPTYSAPAAPTPSYLLDSTAVARTLDEFMQAVAYHDQNTTVSLTCPRLRAGTGTYIGANEIARWERESFTIPPNQTWVQILVKMSLRNPKTGASAGEFDRYWQVEKEDDGNYYVCGYVQ